MASSAGAAPPARMVAAEPGETPAVLPLAWPGSGGAAAILGGLGAEVSGWVLAEGPKEFTRDSLRGCLGDETEQFLAYECQWAVVATYRSADATEGSVAVSVFAFASDLDAFGAFARGRSQSTPAALIHTQAFWSGTQLHIWRGPWYVRVTPSAASEKAKVPAAKLGDAVFKTTPAPPPLPAALTLLPTANLRTYSVKYARRGVLGQDGLGSAVTATYDEDLPRYTLTPTGRRPQFPRTGSMQLVVMEGANVADGQRLFAGAQRALADRGPMGAVPGLGDAAAHTRDTGSGRVVVMRVRNYVAVVYGYSQNRAAEALLRLLGTNIRIMLNARPDAVGA